MTKSVVLGQTVFVLSEEGSVVQTMVGKIEAEGYMLLNGYSNRHQHWFSFSQAIGAARETLEARRAALRKTLRQLAARDRELQTSNYRSRVESAPYKMVDLGDGERRFRTRMRKKVVAPTAHMRPGQRVYAVITPTTQARFDWQEVYRPYTHFVLETEVRSVRLSADGAALYVFATPFMVDEHFLSRDQAGATLRSYTKPGIMEAVPFVSSAEEKKALEQLIEDDIPF